MVICKRVVNDLCWKWANITYLTGSEIDDGSWGTQTQADLEIASRIVNDSKDFERFVQFALTLGHDELLIVHNNVVVDPFTLLFIKSVDQDSEP